jgi:hypothetical protein
MIDAWLKRDLEAIFDKHKVAVFIDEFGDAEFLLDTVEKQYTVHTANTEIEELRVKYLIEREQSSSNKYLIYTQTPKGDLKFIREYCETNGFLEIRYLHNYVKVKVYKTLKLNINLTKAELIAAAKVSIGEDQTYWRKVIEDGIFGLEKELLPFINNPVMYDEKYDSQTREIFYRDVNELLGQEYISKPSKTLAKEVVKAMLDGLALGECDKTLEAVYYNWLDSINFKSSFAKYLNSYSLPSDIDIWAVCPSHPFQQIDDQWLKVIGENIGNKETLLNYLTQITQRMQSEQAQSLGIRFWADVKVLLDFDPKHIAYLGTFQECVDFYANHFYTFDSAIRNLYAKFLDKKQLLEPFQELYKDTLSIFLDKWFKYFDGYQEQQTGLLQRIIDERNSNKIAVVVGDGVSYELARKISERVSNTYKFTKDLLLTDIPSATKNNMSRIYMANGETEEIKTKREKYLSDQNPEIEIEFVNLEAINEDARSSQVLICSAKDIDELGEKLQQKALKHFTETINQIAEKISLLLKSGYSKVYLISDHGFVLTGLLSEADKILVSLDGKHDKAERYIWTTDRQPSLKDRFIEVEKSKEEFNYIYFSKTINPFKTPGVYGFSHGGISPQELITPYFCWEQEVSSTQSLQVRFNKKDELSSVTGELFPILMQSEKEVNDLFATNRKVYLVFFSGKKEINKSDIFEIKPNQTITKEYSFGGYKEIDVILLDAKTKEQLDKVSVKKNKDRDLDGLM